MGKAKKIDTEHNPEPLDDKLDKLIDKAKSESEALKKILKGLETLNNDNTDTKKKNRNKRSHK